MPDEMSESRPKSVRYVLQRTVQPAFHALVVTADSDVVRRALGRWLDREAGVRLREVGRDAHGDGELLPRLDARRGRNAGVGGDHDAGVVALPARAAGAVRERCELRQAGGGAAADRGRAGEIGAEGNIQPARDRRPGTVHEGDALGETFGVDRPGPVQHHGRVVPGVAQSLDHRDVLVGRRITLVDVHRDRRATVDRHAQVGQDPAVPGVHALGAGSGQLTGAGRQDHPRGSERGDQFVQRGHVSTLKAGRCERVWVWRQG
jgi:hypothetical protein